MKRFVLLLTLGLIVPSGALAAPKGTICGTGIGRNQEEQTLHRLNLRLQKRASLRSLTAPSAAPADRDVGHIAVLEDSGDLIIRQKLFNLDGQTISFQPALDFSAYTYSRSGQSLDPVAARDGIPLDRPADDGVLPVGLPFEFPFFGQSYKTAWVDSDGNLQFGAARAGSDRSLGDLLAGAPRIAPLFTDLDPTSGGSIRVFSDGAHVVVSWVDVPEYNAWGWGRVQTFQVRLYPDGRIEFAYNGVTLESAVVGISPGASKGAAVADFLEGSLGTGGPAIAEVFSDSDRVDVISVARRFYETHADSYDYLMVFNNMGVRALDAVAYELPVRTTAKGFGDTPIDIGADYGSARRLQAVINMGPLSQYPTNPDAHVTARGPTWDTTASIMAHEAGHLFLAYVSVPDADNPDFRPMLGFQGYHWAFTFNSEASLLEGNRIRDDGEGQNPRFLTTENVQAYSPLDQYLMGLRAPEEVAPTFVITSPSVGTGYRLPQSAVPINGGRRDININDVIAAAGRRIPDHSVAQRHFRFAVILLVPQGVETPQGNIDKVDGFRQRFESFYHDSTSQRAWADTTIRKAVNVSVAPAGGVVAGASRTATITVDAPAEADLIFHLASTDGILSVPSDVTLPVGATELSFALTGIAAGVSDLTITPADEHFETVYARIPVSDSPKPLNLELVSREGTKIRVRLIDVNVVPYAGVTLRAFTASMADHPLSAVTDQNGVAGFEWTPAAGEEQLTIEVEGGNSLVIRAAPDGISEE